MREWLNDNNLPTLSEPIPIIICSKALECFYAKDLISSGRHD